MRVADPGGQLAFNPVFGFRLPEGDFEKIEVSYRMRFISGSIPGDSFMYMGFLSAGQTGSISHDAFVKSKSPWPGGADDGFMTALRGDMMFKDRVWGRDLGKPFGNYALNTWYDMRMVLEKTLSGNNFSFYAGSSITPLISHTEPFDADRIAISYGQWAGGTVPLTYDIGDMIVVIEEYLDIAGDAP